MGTSAPTLSRNEIITSKYSASNHECDGNENRRGLYVDKCCASPVLSQEPDFQQQKTWQCETVDNLGFRIIYYPKYHCELNFIEMIWGWIKAYHRRNCQFKYDLLKAALPDTLEHVLPLSLSEEQLEIQTDLCRATKEEWLVLCWLLQ